MSLHAERRSSRAGRLREELPPDRGPQVLVQGAPGRAPHAGPPGRRAAVRRQGRAREHAQGASRSRSGAARSRASARAGRRRSCRSREGETSRSSRGRRSRCRSADTSRPRPGRRFMSVSTFEEITKTEPEKSLTEPLKKSGGRNHYGRITRRHQGGGHKRRYRIIDFKRHEGRRSRRRSPRSSTTRTGRRASRCCTTRTAPRRTSSRPRGCRSARWSSPAPAPTSSRATRCRSQNIPTGTIVHNVELQPGRGGQMARSAGSGIQLVAKDDAVRACCASRPARCGACR